MKDLAAGIFVIAFVVVLMRLLTTPYLQSRSELCRYEDAVVVTKSDMLVNQTTVRADTTYTRFHSYDIVFESYAVGDTLRCPAQ